MCSVWWIVISWLMLDIFDNSKCPRRWEYCSDDTGQMSALSRQLSVSALPTQLSPHSGLQRRAALTMAIMQSSRPGTLSFVTFNLRFSAPIFDISPATGAGCCRGIYCNFEYQNLFTLCKIYSWGRFKDTQTSSNIFKLPRSLPPPRDCHQHTKKTLFSNTVCWVIVAEYPPLLVANIECVQWAAAECRSVTIGTARPRTQRTMPIYSLRHNTHTHYTLAPITSQ